MTNRKPVVVKQLNGDLSQTFLGELESYLTTDRPRIVLDCSGMKQLDSTGTQVLLQCLEEAMKRNGDVKLAAVPSRISAALKRRQVDRLFDFFETTSDAVNSFYQFSPHACQFAPQPEFSTLASENAA